MLYNFASEDLTIPDRVVPVDYHSADCTFWSFALLKSFSNFGSIQRAMNAYAGTTGRTPCLNNEAR